MHNEEHQNAAEEFFASAVFSSLQCSNVSFWVVRKILTENSGKIGFHRRNKAYFREKIEINVFFLLLVGYNINTSEFAYSYAN